jgi:hypothetical protein
MAKTILRFEHRSKFRNNRASYHKVKKNGKNGKNE